MKFATILPAALASLVSVASARPLSTASPGALSKRGGGNEVPDSAGHSGGLKPGQVFNLSWKTVPQIGSSWVHEKPEWENAACLAGVSRNCFNLSIVGGPHEHKHGRYVMLDTEKEKGLRLFKDGTIGDSGSVSPGLSWAEGSNHEHLSPEEKEAWGRNVCHLIPKIGCEKMTITSGPQDGTDRAAFAQHGPHVVVDTDKYEGLKVFQDGAIRHPQGHALLSWASTSNFEHLSPEEREKWGKTVCHLTTRMGCQDIRITSGPHKGEDAAMFAKHGQHVHVDTDKHDNLEVYASGLGRMKLAG